MKQQLAALAESATMFSTRVNMLLCVMLVLMLPMLCSSITISKTRIRNYYGLVAEQNVVVICSASYVPIGFNNVYGNLSIAAIASDVNNCGVCGRACDKRIGFIQLCISGICV